MAKYRVSDYFKSTGTPGDYFLVGSLAVNQARHEAAFAAVPTEEGLGALWTQRVADALYAEIDLDEWIDGLFERASGQAGTWARPTVVTAKTAQEAAEQWTRKTMAEVAARAEIPEND
jgi:hypothetical protein